jgi:hypothetical protein
MNRAFLMMCGCLIILASCDKDNFLGKDLLPEEDLLNSIQVDTCKIITYTAYDDSVVTSQNIYYALGSLKNDRYGESTASIYSQLRLPAANVFFGESVGIDSVVLTLDYALYHGDTTALHTVNVYRMSEPMSSSRNYYSDVKFRTLPIPIGRKENFKANFLDSVYLADGSEWESHLRIKLSDSFAANITQLDTNVLASDTSFIEYLQGICIRPDVTDGFANGVMLFDLASSISGVRIYYHNSEADSLSLVFPLTGVNVNGFTHTYGTETDAYAALMGQDTINGNAFTYVQGFGGLRTIIKLPTITDFKDVSINKAELVFTMTNDGAYFFPAPPKVGLVQLDSNGHNFYYVNLYSFEVYSSIVDDNFGQSNIGGIAVKTVQDKTGRTVYEYRYTITRHVQDIIDGDIDNNGFALICYPGNRMPNAVTLGGAQSFRDEFKPRLSITYTTINK